MTMTNDIRKIIRIVHCGFYHNIQRKVLENDILFMIGDSALYLFLKFKKHQLKIQFLTHQAKLSTPSTPNNSNETYTFMGLGRAGRFGQS